MNELATEVYAEDQLGPDLFRVWPKFVEYHVNHSCDANAVETVDDGSQVVPRDIAAGEELTIDYLFHQDGRWPITRAGAGRALAAIPNPRERDPLDPSGSEEVQARLNRCQPCC